MSKRPPEECEEPDACAANQRCEHDCTWRKVLRVVRFRTELKLACELTVDEAKALFESGWWKEMDQVEVARLQLHQTRLCMPIGNYYNALKKLLGYAEADEKQLGPLNLIIRAEMLRFRHDTLFSQDPSRLN